MAPVIMPREWDRARGGRGPGKIGGGQRGNVLGGPGSPGWVAMRAEGGLLPASGQRIKERLPLAQRL